MKKYFLLFSLFIMSSCVNNKVSKNTNLVKITQQDYDIIFDIRYATKNNFTGEEIYENSDLYLHKDSAEKLKIAINYADQLGYKIKVFDGYRSLAVQTKLFEQINDERYVSDPKKGVAGHTRGISIDLTLVDKKTNKELDMGTEFDCFEETAHHRPDVDKQVLQNRLILAGIMSVSGFTPLPSEWWHYNLRTYLIYPDYKNHPKI